ncbi:recombinase family protein [Geminocystis sp. NIES-3709]|uniref:recombinase family protein n=1 Tax=Geminocystis sp. NIES-3709 TaxID=1617448 RepID=UPI0005FCB04B|nr:recombinase family protein [Geminocystis sp. NIES-3709]BAQ66110.1 hypothetical protein GM3709_2875 [Geminocystis sp. NIES-3709]
MIIAYTYTDPIIDKIPNSFIWGCEVDRVYQDIGDRQELTNLLKDCQKSSPNYLLIRSLCEFGNNLTEVTQIIFQIEVLNIEIISIEEDYNSNKFKLIKDSKTKEKLVNIWEEINRKIHSKKLEKSHGNNRLKILPPPGKAPFGYLRGKDSYIINRATAPIVKAFFDRFLLYASLGDSVRYLAEKFNKKIALSTARYWLTNPIYRGDLAYKNKEIISDTHTPILTREESAQIDRILRSHRLVKPRSASANYALAGLIKCQKCQSSFRITQINKKKYQDKYLYLIPTQCSEESPCKALKYNQVFEKTINKICEQLPLLTKNLNAPNPQFIQTTLEKKIEDKENILTQIPKLIQENIFDEETANIRSYKIKLEIAQLKQKIAQLPPDNLPKISLALSNPQFWYDLSPAECRFYLREFIKIIKIIPANSINKNWEIILNFVFSAL